MVIKLQLKFSVSPELKKLGVKVKAAIFSGANIVNRSASLEHYKKDIIARLQDVDVPKNPILEAYSELHKISKVKVFEPPAAGLIEFARNNGRIPNINTVVDSYNIVSAETFLSIGAHDLKRINGDLIIRFADGTEHFIPLGETMKQKVNKGEYVGVEEEKVICWLDIKQCEETKITKETKEYIIYIQGNKNTSDVYLQNALNKVIENQTRFCKAKLLSILS